MCQWRPGHDACDEAVSHLWPGPPEVIAACAYMHTLWYVSGPGRGAKGYVSGPGRAIAKMLPRPEFWSPAPSIMQRSGSGCA